MAVVAELEGKPALAAEQAKAPSTRSVGIKELVDGGLRAVPPLYLRPPHERPVSSLLSSTQEALPHHNRIPIIDLTALVCDTGGTARTHVIQEIGSACEEWGFFQVINHGVELAVIQQLREAALNFFNQPAEERMRFYTEALVDLPFSYKTSFNPAVETVREWRDGLAFSRYPGIFDGFQDAPDLCKKEVVEYMKGMDAIAGKINKAILESLGLERHAEEEALACTIPRVRMGILYYPPCPDPSLTLGLGPHSDVGSLTVLHAGDVPGLEIRQKQTWIPVIPADPSAFIINVADQLEIWTNGKYKSIEHRVVTNRNKPRMSIACFYLPLNETVVAPLPALVDENHPPCFKPTKFGDYMKNVASSGLRANRGFLDFARV